MMNNNLYFFDEPKLKFGFDQSAEDCRDGLTLFGPFEKSSGPIKVGVIGIEEHIKLYSSFVKMLNTTIHTDSTGRPFYPGFNAVFGRELPNVPEAKIRIDKADVEEKLAISNLKERTYQIVSWYLDAMLKFIKDEETVIDIWYVLVSNEILSLCRPKSRSGKASFDKKRIEIFNLGQTSLFADEDKQLEEYSLMYESDSDFHDQLKARALYNHISCPIQVVLESTLRFEPRKKGAEYSNDMKAHLAWTHSTALYYKLGKLPWKLDAVRDGVCYVGLVFKKLQETGQQKGYACSAAQMFLDSGDGVVFRGNIGPWLSKNKKTFHLDTQSAKSLLSIAIQSYKDKHGAYPKELFIHGRTAFTDDEWEGFEQAIQESDQTKLVGVTIKANNSFRMLKDNPDTKEKYGILRGLSLIVDEKSGYLWTKGFIPKTQTANHMEVSSPLYIEINRGDSDIKTVMKDILALTKLNYNACLYGDGIPVTLRFSDRIGDILTAIRDVNWAAKPFKFYI